ncbi:uncharacterized protein [Clytia hemisphaerica]|uniref:uncharacterized protein n=1 Tax=Clytia hemisphaerica TaxID=252671 RepID=UPI0034D7AA53
MIFPTLLVATLATFILPLILLETMNCCNLFPGQGTPTNNHGREPMVIVGEKELEIKKNQLLNIIPILSTEWILTLSVRLYAKETTWCNIIHLTQNGKDVDYGDRTPFLAKRSSPSEFRISSAVNGQTSHNFDIPGDVVVNQTYYFEIHQRYISNGSYRYSLELDGVEQYSILNNDARQFYDVKVMASNNWQTKCPVLISNFKIINFL